MNKDNVSNYSIKQTSFDGQCVQRFNYAISETDLKGQRFQKTTTQVLKASVSINSTKQTERQTDKLTLQPKVFRDLKNTCSIDSMSRNCNRQRD